VGGVVKIAFPSQSEIGDYTAEPYGVDRDGTDQSALSGQHIGKTRLLSRTMTSDQGHVPLANWWRR
jgi:hypothetical protein